MRAHHRYLPHCAGGDFRGAKPSTDRDTGAIADPDAAAEPAAVAAAVASSDVAADVAAADAGSDNAGAISCALPAAHGATFSFADFPATHAFAYWPADHAADGI